MLGELPQKQGREQLPILIEAAKVAPTWNPVLAAVHEGELARGDRNRATLAVARKLVAYLMAVDRGGKPFQAPPAALEQPLQSETTPAVEAA